MSLFIHPDQRSQTSSLNVTPTGRSSTSREHLRRSVVVGSISRFFSIEPVIVRKISLDRFAFVLAKRFFFFYSTTIGLRRVSSDRSDLRHRFGTNHFSINHITRFDPLDVNIATTESSHRAFTRQYLDLTRHVLSLQDRFSVYAVTLANIHQTISAHFLHPNCFSQNSVSKIRMSIRHVSSSNGA